MNFADITHTADFIKGYLNQPKARILEVGCGTGRLAAHLGTEGYDVTGIDLVPENIEQARRAGVKAEVADILTFETTEPFDAVLFTSSLHHIPRLDPVMEKVKTLLAERGRIIVEDFSLERMDEKTAEWFYDLRDVVDSLSGTLAHSEGLPLERWKKEHHHEPPLHTREKMLTALERRFGSVNVSEEPYLYRYFVPSCLSVTYGADAVQRLFTWEKRKIDRKEIQAIGLRVVAKKYFSYLA